MAIPDFVLRLGAALFLGAAVGFLGAGLFLKTRETRAACVA
jgi:hypothetical protein